jgi:histidinol-phosphate aminotransferase
MNIDHKINIFKPYLSGAPAYVGGKSKSEIFTSAEKIYKLSSNENALGSSPKAIEAISHNLHSLFEYPDRTDARLRQALAEHYNHQLSGAHFIATPSGSEMIDLLIRAFVGEGLECIASNPAFQPYFMFTKNQGGQTIDVPLIGEHFELDIDGILSAISDKTRIIFLTSPNNPTGNYIPKNQLDDLIQQVPEHVIVVLDEVYQHFVDADDYTTAMPYVLDGKNVVGLNSFSKSYGLAGMRLGYAYGPETIMSYVRQLCKPFLMSTLAIEAAAAALTDQEFIAKTRAHILKERAYLYRELDALGIKYWQSQGNFIMIKPPMDPAVFEVKILEHGIMVRPVSAFGAPGCVRVTIGSIAANRAYIRGLQVIMSEIKNT